jgi:hypothetical protein
MAKAPTVIEHDEPRSPEAAILTALNAVMQEAGYVQKTGENDFHGYRYATEADVLERLRPAMVKHGLILIPSVQQVSAIDANGNTSVSVHYTLAHVSGAVWPAPIAAAGCGNDRSKNGGVGDKGLYKALTGANKYLLFKLFQIETGNDPEDSEGDKNREAGEKAARQFYLEGGKIAISKAENSADLKVWWANGEEERKNAGIVKGTDEYAELYNVFLSRGKEMVAKEKANG